MQVHIENSRIRRPSKIASIVPSTPSSTSKSLGSKKIFRKKFPRPISIGRDKRLLRTIPEGSHEDSKSSTISSRGKSADDKIQIYRTNDIRTAEVTPRMISNTPNTRKIWYKKNPFKGIRNLSRKLSNIKLFSN